MLSDQTFQKTELLIMERRDEIVHRSLLCNALCVKRNLSYFPLEESGPRIGIPRMRGICLPRGLLEQDHFFLTLPGVN